MMKNLQTSYATNYNNYLSYIAFIFEPKTRPRSYNFSKNNRASFTWACYEFFFCYVMNFYPG